MSKKHKGVVWIDKESKEVIRRFDSIIGASKETGISSSTIITQCRKNGSSNGRTCFVYEEDYNNGIKINCKIKRERKKRKKPRRRYGEKVLMIDKKTDRILKEFDTTGVASKETGIPQGTIASQCIDKQKGRREDVYFAYENDFNRDVVIEENTSEIVKRKEKMYYVNVLVGLANGTLEDGAIYKINDSDLVYNKEYNRLEVAGLSILTQQQMYEEIEIELPLLIEEERKFLKNILKAFSNVKGIRKCNDIKVGFEFIRIETNTPIENVDLPPFVEGKYYKALEQNRLYSVDELGI